GLLLLMLAALPTVYWTPRWPWIALAALALAATNIGDRHSFSARGKRVTVPIFLLALQGALLVFSVLHDPWIDSDAANWVRWVGLAKRIAENGVLGPGPLADRLEPSLLPAFIAAFLDRWRDDLVVLPWVATWVSASALALRMSRGNPLFAVAF